MSDVFPVSFQGAGTVRVQYVPTMADPAAPTLLEVNAAGALNATPYFQAEALQIAHEQARIVDTRLSDESVRESLGLSSFTIDALRYVHNPQAEAAAEGNKAYDKFVPGLNGYLVFRFGTKALKSAAALAATQRVVIYQAQFGDQHQPLPTGDNAVHVIEQPITITLTNPNYILPAGA